MPIGFPGGGLFSRSGAQSGLGSMLQLGGGAPEYDADQINALLQHFGGIQLPGSAYQPQGLFENMPWMTRQAPGLAHGLDNALIALGNMGPTGATAGENISNVARGLSSIGPTRQAQAAASVMLPLQMAGQVAQLKAQGGYMDYLSSMAKYYGGRNDASLDAANTRANIAAQKNAMLAGKEGMILKDGTVGFPYVDDDGQIQYKSHPEIDPKAFAAAQKKKQLDGVMGGSLQGRIIQGILGDDPDSYVEKDKRGKVIGKGPQAYFGAANKLFLQSREVGPSISAGGAADRQLTGNWSTDQRKVYTNLLGKEPTEPEIEASAAEIRRRPGFKGTAMDAMAQARQESQSKRDNIMKSYGQFSGLDEDAQRRAGGFEGFYRSGQATANPAAPRAAAAPIPGLSPAVSAIINSLNNPGKPE